MAWTDLLHAVPSAVESNEGEAEQIYQFLTKQHAGPEGQNLENTRKILKVIIAVLKFKGEQAHAYFEELVKGSSGDVGGASDRVRDLERQLRERNEEIRELRASSGGHIQSELRQLRDENSDQRREIDNLKRQNQRERDEIQRLLDESQHSKDRIRDLERERTDLLRNIDDYREQVQWQSQSLSAGSGLEGGVAHYKELLKKKDRQLNEALDEIERLNLANQNLSSELDTLTMKMAEMEAGHVELIQQVQSLRSALKESDLRVEDSEVKHKVMEKQLEDISSQLLRARKNDEEVMKMVNAKKEEWEKIMKSKDSEIQQLKTANGQLEQQLKTSKIDVDRKKMSLLEKEVSQKSKEVKSLQVELQDATKHLEELAGEVELSRTLAGSSQWHTRGRQGDTGDLLERARELEEEVQFERDQRKQAEEEKAAADEELAVVARRKREYEMGEYGLMEAVDEIKKCKEEIALRDDQIIKLTGQVTDLSAEVDVAYEENEVLRQRLGLSQDEEVDLRELRHKKNVEIEQLRAAKRLLEDQVEKLEGQYTDVRQQLLLSNRNRIERAEVSVKSQDDKEDEVGPLKRELGATRKALEKAKQDSQSLFAESEAYKQNINELQRANDRLNSEVLKQQQKNKKLKTQLKEQSVPFLGKEEVDGNDLTADQESMITKAVFEAKNQWETQLNRFLDDLKQTQKQSVTSSPMGTIKNPVTDKHITPDSDENLKEIGHIVTQLKEENALLTKKLEIVQNEASQLQKRFSVLKEEKPTSKTETKKLKYLLEWKADAEHKLSDFESKFLDWIPKSELQSLEREYSDLSGKLQASINKQHLLLEKTALAERLSTPNVQANEVVTHLESRCKTLEDRCTELAQQVIDMQKAELQLRQDISGLADGNCKVTQLHQRLQSSEHLRQQLTKELEEVKEMEAFSREQCLAMATISQSQEQEITLLKQQLLDFQSKSDAGVTIAKLNQYLSALQTSEASALQKFEAVRLEKIALESSLLKTERQLDDQKRELRQVKQDYTEKITQLQGDVRALHRKYTLAMPTSDSIKRLSSDVPSLEFRREAWPAGVESGTQFNSTKIEITHLRKVIDDQKSSILKLQHEVDAAMSSKGQHKDAIQVKDSELAVLKSDLATSKMNASALEKVLQETRSVLLKRETEMAEMRIQLGRLRDSSPLHHATAEKDLVTINVAQQTINDLKSIIVQKEAQVEKYQGMLQHAHLEAHTLTHEHKKEMTSVIKKLQKEKDTAFMKFKQASMDAIHKIPSESKYDELLAKIHELEDTLAQKEIQCTEVMAKVKVMREDQQVSSEQYQQHINRLKQEANNCESEHQHQIAQLEKVITEKSRRIAHLETEVEVMEGELRASRQEALKSPLRASQSVIERLKKELLSKDQQYKVLTEALVQVRGELIEATQKAMDRKRESKLESEESGKEAELERRCVELQAKVDMLQSQVTSLEEQMLKSQQARERNIAIIDQLEEKLLQRDSRISNLEAEVRSRQKVIDQVHDRERKMTEEMEKLQQRIEHHSEVEELQKRVKILQAKLDKEKQKCRELEDALKAAREQLINVTLTSGSGGPSGTAQVKHTLKESSDEVIRWEESKKWQRKLEGVKAKLSEKTRELEENQKQIKSFRETIERSERERSQLQSKLKSLQRAHVADSTQDHTTTKEPHAKLTHPVGAQLPSLEHHQEAFKMKSRIFELENELQKLKFQHGLSGDNSTTSALSKAEADLQHTISKLKVLSDVEDFSSLLEQIECLQNQLLKCQKENMMLQFEHEQAVSSLPRLKTRVTDLEEYIEVLKRSLTEAEKKALSSQSGEKKEVTSKSAAELERVVNAMKRVIEKLKSENEELKRKSSRRSRGGEESEGTAKKDSLEVLKAENTKIKGERDTLIKDLQEEREKVSILQAKVSKFEVAHKKREDQREKSDQVKILESTVLKLQAKLEEKTKTLKDAEEGLKMSIKREEELSKMDSAREQLHQMKKERNQLLQENKDLRKELDNFDSNFFEEIEDLKYNYHEALQKIANYEQQLKIISRQFGTSMPEQQ